MKAQKGNGQTKYGPGLKIILSAEEVALAISAYIVAMNIHIEGPRSISVNEDLIEGGEIYVDPSGSIIENGERFLGRTGEKE